MCKESVFGMRGMSIVIGLVLSCWAAACQTENEPACGDGVVDNGEACDDGNTQSGDGCSAICQPDDNLATPGDERPGYIDCGGGVTCGPGYGCKVGSGPLATCEPNLHGGSLGFTTCDGPEDCPAGQVCNTDHVTSCGAPEIYVKCHTDADCDRPDLNPCRGTCYAVANLCGDGIIDAPGETCDDGNHDSGDGCSSTCQPDDNLATPGDDRAGYVTCSPKSGGPSLTCGPGQFCAYTADSTSCVPDQGQSGGFDITVCDGPEDCAAGERCFDNHVVYCGTEGPIMVCHSDADCDRPEVNPCLNGGCYPSAKRITCGNGIVDPEEECDDGNHTSGDGCSNNCELEQAATVGQ